MARTAPLPFRVVLLSSAVWGAALNATAAFGQSEPIVLDTITLVATGLPTEIMQSPASISVISADDIRESAPVSVATLMRNIPGVNIQEEGIERISIRGEDSRRVAILIDGQKLTDHTNYGQPVLIDPTTIERIEVVRGSSSVVSGSRAIGGVINIITKRGADRPFALSTTAGYISATEGYRVSISAAGTVQAGAGKMDYRLTAGRMEQNDRHTPDGILKPSDVSDRSLSGHLGYQLGNQYFGLRGQAYDLSANVFVEENDFSIALPKRDLRKISAFYEISDVTPWLRQLSADLYYQTVEREFISNVSTQAGPMALNVRAESEDEQRTTGLNLRAEMDLWPGTRTVAGLEIEDDRLDTDKTTTTTITPPGAPAGFTTSASSHDEASIRTISLFAQHEVSFSEIWTGTFGARWYDVDADHEDSTTDGIANDRNSNSDSLLLGSAGLVWSPDDSLAVRANLSQGYIYPTLGQLFLTTAAGGEGTIYGNPDLKPETSTTFELGLRYDTGATTVDAALFYTDADDYIARVATGPRSFTYENVDAAKSWGLELQAEHHLTAWNLTPYVSVALMRRELEYSNGYSTFDSGAPTTSGRIGIRRDWQVGSLRGNLDLYLRGESGTDLRGEDGSLNSSYGGYATLNMKGDVDFGNGLMLVAELNNLTDRSYQPYEQMPGAERSVNLFFTKSF
ncbi:TonB-dependent receptor [Paracoccus aerodenitrificans]|uniref:TonB-dependent receptor n=1 Tax=Paracoccus aerodenitrificans TaxID=3017781 RepID=UPI0022F03143|nr:TonB-dependent receptor [Paracoccus aerodenitrificans]WBU62772.1 TonB-dependent receptor [Paracoccus aerodenitrificans]